MTQTVGWALFVVGCVLCIGGLIFAFVQQQAAKKSISQQNSKAFPSLDLKAIQELLESLAKVMEQFAKFAMPIQFSVLGVALMVIGTLLIVYKP